MYVGPTATSVRVPEVRTVEGDDKVWQISYPDSGCEEITVETWKEMLAEEWGISLFEIKSERARQATPEDSRSLGSRSS
jgi:hypothetical protein